MNTKDASKNELKTSDPYQEIFDDEDRNINPIKNLPAIAKAVSVELQNKRNFKTKMTHKGKTRYYMNVPNGTSYFL